jgi:hypothetical protein
MKDIDQSFSEGTLLSDNDIDELFSHLEQFEPPADSVERIMREVSRLPPPQLIPKSSVEKEFP